MLLRVRVCTEFCYGYGGLHCWGHFASVGLITYRLKGQYALLRCTIWQQKHALDKHYYEEG